VATRVAGSRALVRLHFDELGDTVAALAADRRRAIGKRSVPTPFAGEFGDYRSFGGVRVPTTGVVAGSWGRAFRLLPRTRDVVHCLLSGACEPCGLPAVKFSKRHDPQDEARAYAQTHAGVRSQVART